MFLKEFLDVVSSSRGFSLGNETRGSLFFLGVLGSFSGFLEDFSASLEFRCLLRPFALPGVPLLFLAC